MKKFKLAQGRLSSVSAMALTAGLSVATQLATVGAIGTIGVVTVEGLTSAPAYAFATASTASAITFSTVLTNSTATLPSTSVSISVGTVQPVGAIITLTAPTGVGFQFAPVVTTITAAEVVSAVGFTSGANSVTYQVSGQALSSADSLKFSSFNLTNLNAYSGTTGATSSGLVLTVSSNVVGTTSLSIISAAAIASFTAPVTITASGTTGASIDVSTGATKFGASSAADTVAVTLGSVSFQDAASTVVDYDAQSAVYAASGSGTVTVTPSAGTNGLANFSTIYASTTGTCSTTVPTGAAQVAVTSPTAAVLTSVSTPSSSGATNTVTICGIVNGTGVLNASTYTLKAGASATNTAGATAVAVTAVTAGTTMATTYTGSLQVNGFYVGSGGNGFASYENVINTGSTAANVLFVAQDPITGATKVGASTTTIPAGGSILFTPTMVNAAFGGTSPFPSENNGKLSVLTSNNGSIIQHLLYSPGSGTLSQVSPTSGTN